MDIPIICRARYHDPITHQVETFTEQFPCGLSNDEVQFFVDNFTSTPFTWERFAELFPTEAIICEDLQYKWSRYVAARIVRRGPMFRLMQLQLGNAMQYLQEDITNNGFVPTVSPDSPTYSKDLFEEWTDWEDLVLQKKSVYERLEIYKDRYHIDITDVSEIEFDSWMSSTPVDDELFYD